VFSKKKFAEAKEDTGAWPTFLKTCIHMRDAFRGFVCLYQEVRYIIQCATAAYTNLQLNEMERYEKDCNECEEWIAQFRNKTKFHDTPTKFKTLTLNGFENAARAYVEMENFVFSQ